MVYGQLRGLRVRTSFSFLVTTSYGRHLQLNETVMQQNNLPFTTSARNWLLKCDQNIIGCFWSGQASHAQIHRRAKNLTKIYPHKISLFELTEYLHCKTLFGIRNQRSWRNLKWSVNPNSVDNKLILVCCVTRQIPTQWGVVVPWQTINMQY